MLTIKNITKFFGSNLILKNVSFTLKKRESLGIVGPNGIGKTTLLRIIEGSVELDSGTIEKSKDVCVCYIPQEIVPLSQSETGRDYLMRMVGFKFTPVSDDKELQSFLGKLSIDPNDFERPLCTLSGGLRAKIALLPLFFFRADVFLLDEPTNNLDLPGLLFLEQKVIKSSSSFLIVSHDRKFLDRIVSKTIEIDEFSHTTTIYDGGFTVYLREREKRIEHQWQRYKEYEQEANRLLESARKQKEKAQKGKSKSKHTKDKDKLSHGYAEERSRRTTDAAKSLKKRLEQLEKVEKPRIRLPLRLNFEVAERSGDIVFELQKVLKKKGCFSLGPIDLTVSYGMRIAILGPNGSGKTTLLKIFTENDTSDSGMIKIGSRVNIGYLPQELNLTPDKTLLTEFLSQSPLDETTGRKLLNRFGLEETDVNKRIKDLSPGERSRLILAILMSQRPNCLILDEPSNHLDLEALTQLEKALMKYSGTLIIVSHDRYLLDRIPFTTTFVLEKNGLLKSVTNYSVYERSFLDEPLK